MFPSNIQRFIILIHENFTYVPDLRSDITDGRMHKGGTGILVSMRSLGCPHDGFIIKSGTS